MIDTTYRWPMVLAVVMITLLLALSQNAKGGHDSGDEHEDSNAIHSELVPPNEVSAGR